MICTNTEDPDSRTNNSRYNLQVLRKHVSTYGFFFSCKLILLKSLQIRGGKSWNMLNANAKKQKEHYFILAL